MKSLAAAKAQVERWPSFLSPEATSPAPPQVLCAEGGAHQKGRNSR